MGDFSTSSSGTSSFPKPPINVVPSYCSRGKTSKTITIGSQPEVIHDKIVAHGYVYVYEAISQMGRHNGAFNHIRLLTLLPFLGKLENRLHSILEDPSCSAMRGTKTSSISCNYSHLSWT